MPQETVAAGEGKRLTPRFSVTIPVEAANAGSAPSAKSIQARASGVLSLLPSPLMPKAVRCGLPLALRARGGPRRGNRAAEHHVALAGIGIATGVRSASPDDQVRQAVAIDVTGAGNADAGVVVGIDAVDPETADAQHGEIDRRAAGLAEHHIAFAGTEAADGAGPIGADDQIG